MLELRGVGFAYAGGEQVFRDVTFTVRPGTATAVLGPNGRGKTTLVRCAAGLLKPTEGTVCRDAPVGFVPQARRGAFGFTVREMVLMGRAGQVRLFSSPGCRDHAAAESAMERVGISHLADRRFPSLSGGEQQLTLVARAVASGSPIMVLDEPATGLDLRNQGQILVLIRSLVAEGMSVLMTTHHPDNALLVSDSVILMHGPDDVRCGDAKELLTDEELSSLYGVRVRSVTYDDPVGTRHALVTRYEGLDERLSPTQVADPSAQPRH